MEGATRQASIINFLTHREEESSGSLQIGGSPRNVAEVGKVMDKKEEPLFEGGSDSEITTILDTPQVGNIGRSMLEEERDIGTLSMNVHEDSKKLEKAMNVCMQIGTPSVEQDKKLLKGMNSDENVNVNGIMGMTNDEKMNENGVIERNSTDEKCEHNKKGWCDKHEEYARKVCTTKKVWSKKKNGLFGYLIRKQTNYQCMGRGYWVQSSDQKNQELGNNSQPQNTAQESRVGVQLSVGNSAQQYMCTVAGSGLVGGDLPGGASQIIDRESLDKLKLYSWG